jgi:hypothetical protein
MQLAFAECGDTDVIQVVIFVPGVHLPILPASHAKLFGALAFQ